MPVPMTSTVLLHWCMGVVLRSDGTAQRLDEGALHEGKRVGKQKRAGIHVDLGQPQVLCEARRDRSGSCA